MLARRHDRERVFEVRLAGCVFPPPYLVQRLARDAAREMGVQLSWNSSLCSAAGIRGRRGREQSHRRAELSRDPETHLDLWQGHVVHRFEYPSW